MYYLILYCSIQEPKSRFGPIIIQPDNEVEAFREKIYKKIQSVIIFSQLCLFN